MRDSICTASVRPLTACGCFVLGNVLPEVGFSIYNMEPLRFIRKSAFTEFGGAPGFLVRDDGHVRTNGWHEMFGLLPPEQDRVVSLPEVVSVRHIAEIANVSVYTIAVMSHELTGWQMRPRRP